MIARVIQNCADNPRLVVFICVVLAILGGLAGRTAPVDAVPDLSDPQVVIVTDWEGRSADVVEDQITYPLSSALSSQPGVRVVRAQSFFGTSFVTVIFDEREDPLAARARVLEAITAGRVRLPEGARPTVGPDASGVGWVLEYALRSDDMDVGRLRSLQDFVLRPALASVEGVAEVASLGGFAEEVQVHLDPVRMRAVDCKLEDVIAAVRGAVSDTGGDVIEMAGHEIMVRARASNATIDDVASAAVTLSASGAPIHVGDVADVSWGPGPRRGVADLNGEGEVVGGIVITRRGADARTVIALSKQRMDSVRTALPPGVELVITYDRSELISRSTRTLLDALVEEMLVVLLISIAFLLHPRSALVPMVVLPIAMLVSFLPIRAQGLTLNLMSLGGIAVAIGEMVDASVVLIDNVHRRRHQFPEEGDRLSALRAMQEVGPSIFFSLLVMTVSFFPVLMLPGVEGRLFAPLALTKTWAMAAAALLAVTLTPALVVLLVRGKAVSEDRNPVLRVLEHGYARVVRAVVHRPVVVIAGAFALMAATVPVALRIEGELMPALDEGSLLYMPTSPPGMSIAEARDVLIRLDGRIKQFPEVQSVFGKMGRAETATDPAPIGMAEIVIVLKDKDQWRPGITREKLVAEMDAALQVPGMPNIWWMPIQTRTEMLATGVRSPLAVELKGGPHTDARTLEQSAAQVQQVLRQIEGARSVVAERLLGATALDVEVDREAVARAGLSVQQVHEVVSSAVGGVRAAEVIRGRERLGVRVRLARELRDDPGEIEDLVIASPAGPVRLGDVAKVALAPAPDMVKSEDGELLATVFIDTDRPIDSFATDAEKAMATLQLPPGVRWEWAGQIEHLNAAHQRLAWAVPVVLFIIVLLLYASTRSVPQTAIVLMAVPFSLVGAVWLLWAWGAHASVAVWVGVIALLGLDAETGVVMLLYLTLSHQRFMDEGRLNTRADLDEAVVEGAARRLRPKLMTVATTAIGLLPILWSTGTGADVMKPIALPVVGGLTSSFLLELLVYPALFVLWKRRALPPPS